MSGAWQRDGYEAVIGLEIHVQLNTASKMFCACPNRYGDEPNTNVCMVCLAHPGALPVANAEAVRQSARVGLALGCRIPAASEFSRKQYFYPDSPKAYQISQYDQPLCAEGSFHVPGEGAFTVRITRAHLEEDAAKMIHAGGDAGRIQGSAGSVVDFNRAGTPLLEIVTEPDIRSPEQARRFLTLLRATVVAIGASDCDMEKGSLRADANVSIRPLGSEEYGTKTELKDMNSFRFLERGIEAELERQLGLVQAGEAVRQETLHFDPATGGLTSLRSKEEAHDYRYFPEPDLLPVTQDPDDLAALAGQLPELPVARFARLTGLGLPEATALLLATEVELAAYYDDLAGRVGDAKVAANWVMGELQAHLNAAGIAADATPVTPERLAGLVALVVDGTINQTSAKEVFQALVEDPAATAAGVVEGRGLAQVGDADELGAIVDRVLADHPDEVAAFRGGREQVVGFLVGQCMKASGGRADAKALQALLRERLTP
ncbi:MAG: Asp-tRNA(Asn)/Glu-tRNA(Gln) amidotransferase subunit GatB [Actinomycetota bacterium]